MRLLSGCHSQDSESMLRMLALTTKDQGLQNCRSRNAELLVKTAHMYHLKERSFSTCECTTFQSRKRAHKTNHHDTHCSFPLSFMGSITVACLRALHCVGSPKMFNWKHAFRPFLINQQFSPVHGGP